MSKLLAFFASDLKHVTPDFLVPYVDEGFGLLALDVAGMELAGALGLPYTLVDDWIDHHDWLKSYRVARENERRWYEAGRDALTAQDVCWPTFDHHAMQYFWVEVALAHALAGKFRDRNVRTLVCFQQSPPRAGLYHYPADIYGYYWKYVLADGSVQFSMLDPSTLDGQAIPSTRRTSRPLWRRVLGRARRELRGVKPRLRRLCIEEPPAHTDEHARTSSISDLAGRIVLACNAGEAHRLTPVVRNLQAYSPGQVAGVILNNNPRAAMKLAEAWSMPVLCGPSYRSAEVGLVERFRAGVDQVRRAADGEGWEQALSAVPFHFEYYCDERWPGLARAYVYWHELWQQTSPRAILVSSLCDAESQLPAEAARRAGIATFSVPHGGVDSTDTLISAQHVLCECELQRFSWQLAGFESNRLIDCGRIVARDEYPAVARTLGDKRSEVRLLCLTNPITPFDQRLWLGVGARKQATAIRDLAAVPADLADRVEICFKPHPQWPELQLFRSIGEHVASKVVPPDSALETLLKGTDLVVAINYYGTALMHALRERKPVIFFWSDARLRETGVMPSIDPFKRAGPVARTADEFWALVRAFVEDPEVAEHMRTRAREFASDYLDDSDYPDIAEVLQQALEDGRPTRSVKRVGEVLGPAY